MSRGKFIVIEGSDGVGKDSVINTIKETMGSTDFIFSREPGGTPISEKIRDILLDKSNGEMGVYAEMLLYQASRAQHCDEVVMPALDKGINVLCNRFYHSTLIYQILRGCNPIDVINSTVLAVRDKCYPDLVISLYTEDADTLMERMEGRDKDRLELQGQDFWENANEGYKNLKAIGHYINKSNPYANITSNQLYPVVHINNSKPMDEVREEVQSIIRKFLEE